MERTSRAIGAFILTLVILGIAPGAEATSRPGPGRVYQADVDLTARFKFGISGDLAALSNVTVFFGSGGQRAGGC